MARTNLNMDTTIPADSVNTHKKEETELEKNSKLELCCYIR